MKTVTQPHCTLWRLKREEQSNEKYIFFLAVGCEADSENVK